MYCPKCSQQQVADEMRFCSRCGFPLSGVRELVASGGAPVEREAGAQVVEPSPALKGMRKGVWLMLAGVPLAIVAGLLAALDDVFAILVLLPVLCFAAGFVRLLYGTFFETRTPNIKRTSLQPPAGSMTTGQLDEAARGTELSPSKGTTIEGFTAQRLKTQEMGPPSSVTESTTRLLDEEANLGRG